MNKLTRMYCYTHEVTFSQPDSGLSCEEEYDISEEHQAAIDDVIRMIKGKPLSERLEPTHNKYAREIRPKVWVDVYDTLAAFTGDVSSRIKPAVDHALKKLLAPGKRGVKDERQDLVEARESLDRAIQLIDDWC